MNDLFLELDKGNVVMLALLDLSSAFDTVDHDILLNRLKLDFGFNDTVLNWFRSYLTDRTQSVSIGGQHSKSHTMNCSVPQGSVLGPQLYSKYTVGLSDIIAAFLLSYHFYADDTQIYKGFKPDGLENQTNAVNIIQIALRK